MDQDKEIMAMVDYHLKSAKQWRIIDCVGSATLGVAAGFLIGIIINVVKFKALKTLDYFFIPFHTFSLIFVVWLLPYIYRVKRGDLRCAIALAAFLQERVPIYHEAALKAIKDQQALFDNPPWIVRGFLRQAKKFIAWRRQRRAIDLELNKFVKWKQDKEEERNSSLWTGD
jgi:hypothetical protein